MIQIVSNFFTFHIVLVPYTLKVGHFSTCAHSHSQVILFWMKFFKGHTFGQMQLQVLGENIFGGMQSKGGQMQPQVLGEYTVGGGQSITGQIIMSAGMAAKTRV